MLLVQYLLLVVLECDVFREHLPEGNRHQSFLIEEVSCLKAYLFGFEGSMLFADPEAISRVGGFDEWVICIRAQYSAIDGACRVLSWLIVRDFAVRVLLARGSVTIVRAATRHAHLGHVDVLLIGGGVRQFHFGMSQGADFWRGGHLQAGHVFVPIQILDINNVRCMLGQVFGHLGSQVYWSTRAQRVLKPGMIVPGVHVAKLVVQLEVHLLDAGGVCDISCVVRCTRLLLQL